MVVLTLNTGISSVRLAACEGAADGQPVGRPELLARRPAAGQAARVGASQAATARPPRARAPRSSSPRSWGPSGRTGPTTSI